jgi:hypothetical protein
VVESSAITREVTDDLVEIVAKAIFETDEDIVEAQEARLRTAGEAAALARQQQQIALPGRALAGTTR